MLEIAMEQSACDINCSPNDFLRTENVLVELNLNETAKKYYYQPINCNFISYGNNVVAASDSACRALVKEYISRFTFYNCFKAPNLFWLEKRLLCLGLGVCFMAEYYLPDTEKLKPLDCHFKLKKLYAPDFEELYKPEWSNALCEFRRELDVLGIGAYDGGKLIGLAGCSADCGKMWQIGIDVLPEYRQKGVASSLTSRLALEILNCGKVPFYCAAWSNIRSIKNAMKSGFVPAWAEMTVKPTHIIDEINGEIQK